MLKLKKTIVALAIGGTLLGGGAYAASAYASTPTAGTTTASASTSGHASGSAMHTWLREHRKEIRRAGIAISAKTIGITPKDLRSELRSGESVAGVATEHGVTAQAVVDALVGAADTAVDRAAAANELTAVEAAQIKAALPSRITKAVNRLR